jgi:tetratricopeptide (TPR) repeat protein
MKKIIVGALLVVSTITFAQKKNTTNAAMSYSGAQSSVRNGNVEQAAKDLLEAKGFIDLAAQHADTKNDPKTLLYKGKIYLEIGSFGEMAKDETIMAMDGKELAKEGVDALKSVKENDSKGRYESDVADYCNKFRYQGYEVGINMFQNGKYEEAMQGFGIAATFADVMGITDSASYFNSGLAAFNIKEWEVVEESFEKCVEIGYKYGSSVSYLTEAYKQLEKIDKAEVMLNEQLVKHPGDKDIMISLINILLAQDKKVEAEKVLSDAIAVDPNNKDLHYAVATVYENLERYDDAEKAYLKVLDLDPTYTDALLGLGAVYFNKAADFNAKINELSPNDPQEEQYRGSMKDNFKKALPYLAKADELNPNDKEILNSLKQAYYKLGMIDEFKATKAKIDAIK